MAQEPKLTGESPDIAGGTVVPGQGPEESYERRKSRRDERRMSRGRPSIFWPLLLISVGVLLLLANLNYISWDVWNLLWRFWPVIPIAIGIDLLFARRSLLGAFIAFILIALLFGGVVALVFLAPNIPSLSQYVQPMELRTEHFAQPLEGLEGATIRIDWGRAPLELEAAAGSGNLIEADVTYRGGASFEVERSGNSAEVNLSPSVPGFVFWAFPRRDRELWQVGLSSKVPIKLNLNSSFGEGALNLTGLQISDLFLDASSGAIQLVLPSAGKFEARVEGGSGAITIVLPQDMAARVELEDGSASFNPDARLVRISGRGGEGVWETKDFATSSNAVTLRIDQGSGSITIR